jgi:hypothetical protein
MSDAPRDPQTTSSAAEATAEAAGESASVAAPVKRESAGCFPAVLAATLLMGMVLFITFGFAGYLIFLKRGDLAARTLRGTIIPEYEQSRLSPEEKSVVIRRFTRLAEDIENKKLENWQAGGVMNRLIRAPLLRWGDLQAVDAWAKANFAEADYAAFHKQISRFFRAAELDRAIASDLQDILATVTGGDPAMMLGRLKPELVESDVREVAVRAKLVADRAEIPDQTFEDVSLPKIIDRLIETGMRDGTT